MIEEIAKRWDAAIRDVLRRADAVIGQANVESEPLLAALGADFQPLSRLWTKTQADVKPLREEIQNLWNAISDELSATAPPEGVMDREGDKRDLATTELDARYQLAFRLVMKRAAESLKQRADATGDRALKAAFEGSGARYLGEWEAHVDWVRMTKAQTRINSYRDAKDVPITLLKELEASSRRYHTTVLSIEAEHVPLQKPYVAAKIDRYMKDVERTLRQYWQWRARSKEQA
jgi:hypothetical protein